MRLPPAEVIIADVLSKRVVTEGLDEVGRQVEIESGALAAARAFETGATAAGIRRETIPGPVPRVRVTTGEGPPGKEALPTWLERGTGIYGPERRPIRPKKGKFLVFRLPAAGASAPRGSMSGQRRDGPLIFAREVRGREASWFMRDAARDVAARLGLRFRILREGDG